jgi:hypothetical protein
LNRTDPIQNIKEIFACTLFIEVLYADNTDFNCDNAALYTGYEESMLLTPISWTYWWFVIAGK